MSAADELRAAVFFNAARSYGADAKREPDPQRRCDLYMTMIDRDIKAAESGQWAAPSAAQSVEVRVR
jgi:hypothetical protein